MNKLLHSPTVRLRRAAGNGRGLDVIDTVRYLFELDRGVSEPGDTTAPQGDASDPERPSDPERLQPDERET
jgi:hypothetical protein